MQDKLDLSNKELLFTLFEHREQLALCSELNITNSCLLSKNTQQLRGFCKNLEILNISNNSIDSRGAVDLSNMKTLKQLTANNCGIGAVTYPAAYWQLFLHQRLQDLSLDDNPITVAAMVILANYNYALRSLSLRNCKLLDDQAEPILSRCALRSIEMSGSGISEAAQTRIKNANKANLLACQDFVDRIITLFQMRRVDNSLLKSIPQPIVENIAYFIGEDLPKRPMQIAACIVLIADNLQHRRWQTQLTHPLKVSSLTLVKRVFASANTRNFAKQIPDYYLDQTNFSIFRTSK